MPDADHPLPTISAEGWLFDLYAQGDRVVLWFVTAEEKRLRLTDRFTPSFYIGELERLEPALVRQLRQWIEEAPGLEWVGPAERLDLWSGHPCAVEEIRMSDLDRAGPNVRALARRFPGLTLFNCDIPPEIHYGYERGLFPTARCTLEHAGGRLLRCTIQDDPLATTFALPELRVAELKAEGVFPGRRPRLRSLALTFEGRTYTWESGAPAEMLASLRDALRQADPDLIWTEGGDSTLIPTLLALARLARVELGLDREPAIERQPVQDGRSYMSYGRILYQAPDYPLFGRWHIDRHNSFWAHTTGLEGLIEVARMSKIPVQRAARRSIGTGISSIELDHAYRLGYLIPWKKCRPEGWKSAATLLKTDRGGLVYQPLTGVYEGVIELDFVSMYPSIMVHGNVSPETVNCECCGEGAEVPEIGYRICRRRRGLIPQALEPIIEKRRQYKRLMKQAAGEDEAARFGRRQEALKWLLVCCFGYLGYRNARFGRIEAHETTCAFSREILLRAREVCEERGFRMLHAIVDCVWLEKPGANAREIEALIEAINHATGLTIALEGRYRWVVFLPSRQDPEAPVPNRYFGLFESGKLKYRGIEIRRGDQAPYVQEVQGELLELLGQAGSLAECRALKEELLGVVRRAEERLRCYDVPLERLVLERRTSREADQYRGQAMTAVAARQAARAGIELHAGQAVRYLVINAKDADPDGRVRLLPLLAPGETYDPAYYLEQVQRAAATVLEPLLGEPLEKLFGRPGIPARARSGAKATPAPATPPRIFQPDLFAGDGP